MIDREISCLGPLGRVFKPANLAMRSSRDEGISWLWVGQRRQEIAVNFPLPMFLAKDTQWFFWGHFTSFASRVKTAYNGSFGGRGN